jgi:hypothetical protein
MLLYTFMRPPTMAGASLTGNLGLQEVPNLAEVMEILTFKGKTLTR